MANLLQLSPVALAMPLSTDKLSDSALLSQMVLTWDQAIAPPARQPLSANCLAATQRLIKRIAQLRSVENGLTDPQSLLPFVSDEAESVADCLKEVATAVEQAEAQIGKPVHPRLFSSDPQHFKAFVAQLLWTIAQSTHEAIQLIEGCPAQVSPRGKPWQSGILRLLVILDLQTPQTTDRLDLVTCLPVSSSLSNCQIQIPNGLLGQQPVSEAVFLQRLLVQMVTTEPALERLFQGTAAAWLLPDQAWQSGQVRLRLGCEFIPIMHSVPALLPQLKFTQPAWLEQHITTAVEHQLTQTLQHNFRAALLAADFPHRASDQPEAPEDTEKANRLMAIVQQGSAAIDDLQCSLSLASRTFAQQPLLLDQLALRLLWGINRTAYEVMQLTSGIPVSLLQPQQTWTAGLLRFVALLTLRTPEQVWQFDLARRALSLDFAMPAATAIVQSCEHAWVAQPLLLNQLEAKLWQQIEQTAPEVALLKLSTEVNVEIEASQWQVGTVQLQTGFEFVPDRNFELFT